MKLYRRRWLFAALVAALVLAVAWIPFSMWRSERHRAIVDELDHQLTAQMEEVLYGDVIDQPQEWPIAWYVNVNDNYTDELSTSGLEPPLLTWMRDAGDAPNTREYELDNATGLRALIRPFRDGEGYITIAYTSDRDEALDDLNRHARNIAFGLLAASALIGTLVSGFAVLPVRKLLADQQSFLADAAHEMRTPLAVILASSSQALSRPRSTEEYVRSLSEIRSASERAAAGVNEMLDLVRFETGQSMPRIAPLRLDLLAEEIAAAIRPEDAIVIAEPSDPVVVAADMALLRQALENLVRNAARRSTRVELVTTCQKGDGIISVIDNGPGFDPAVLPRVFERYQRGDRQGEAGIGLAIVRAIAVAHGGTATAMNNEDGSGATVSLRIPLSRLA